MRYNPLLHGNAKSWDEERKHHKGGGGGGGNTTSTTKMEPPAQVLPYLSPFMDKAWSVTNSPYQAYQGQRIADLTGEQRMGANLTSAQALNGFQGQNDGMQVFQDTMQGRFMDPNANPWLAATANKAMGDISNNYRTGTAVNTNAAAARAGAFGGSAWRQQTDANERALGDSLGNAANQFYGQNYFNERNNQMQALGMMPTLQNMGYTDAEKLMGVGDSFRQYQQDLLNSQYGDWQEAQNYPVRMLDIFGNQLRATMGAGGSSSTTQSGGYQPSRFANAAGGAMAGFGMGGPVGAAIGGLGGLLL